MEELPKYPEVAAIFTRLLSELGLSGNQLAKALGTSQQVISGYASGRTNPGREMIASIIDRYPAINAAWLVTGIGEPFPAGRFNEKAVAVAHAKPTGAATATVHPTVQPNDKELTGGTATGPFMYDEDPVVQQLLLRLAEKDRIIERQQEDIDAWRDAFRKPLASAEAAAHMAATPISLRPSACVEAKVLPLFPVAPVEVEEAVAA